jgi:hypothetical protein
MASRTTAWITLLVSLSGAPALASQTSVPPPTQVPPASSSTQTPPTSPETTPPSQSGDPAALPVDLTRIRTVLDRNAPSKIDAPQLRFYLDVVARRPTFKEFLGSYDLINGPVKGAQMTHQEFLDMVTPKLLHSSAGFTGTEVLQVALTNWAAMSIIKKAVSALKNARNDDEVRTIRAQIDRELAALRGGG